MPSKLLLAMPTEVTAPLNCFLQVLEQEIVVKPGDSDIVRLSILPLRPGLIKIVGLAWILNGQAQGRRLFATKASQHRRTGSRYIAAAAVADVGGLQYVYTDCNLEEPEDTHLASEM